MFVQAKSAKYLAVIGVAFLTAAGIWYFSRTSPNPKTEEIQGTIGQRNVERNGQINEADVNATPGTSPVAVQEFLKSKEFKKVASDPAFQSLVGNQDFQKLAGSQDLQSLVANQAFQALVGNQNFQAVLANRAFQTLVANQAFQNLVGHQGFQSLVSSQALQGVMANQGFQQLVSVQNGLSSLKADMQANRPE